MKKDVILMMIIIDDDFRMSEKIKDELAAYQIKDVHTFTSTKDCSLEMIMKADLIFLDIEMPDENGLDFAKRIRKKDPNKKIIFISSHEEYVFDSFALQPFFFIRKTNLIADFKRAIETYQLDLERNARYLIIKYNRELKKIDFNKIIFIEKYKDYVILHLTDEAKVKLNQPLKSIIKELSDSFCMINRSIVINLYHLVKIDNIFVIMSNDEKLEISRRKRGNVTEALYKYVRGD